MNSPDYLGNFKNNTTLAVISDSLQKTKEKSEKKITQTSLDVILGMTADNLMTGF